MAKTIDLNQIKDVLVQIRANCPDQSVKVMFESLYEFLDLFSQRNRIKSNRREFDEKMRESYAIIYQLVEKTTAEHGLDGDTLGKWLEDPSQILSSEWDGR